MSAWPGRGEDRSRRLASPVHAITSSKGELLMQNPPSRGRRIGGIAAACVLIVFGVGAAVQGADGRSTVHDALVQEAVVGTPTMSPSAIAEEIAKRGVAGIDVPTCDVAGKPIDDGAGARCFAEYMRVDALIATGGKTYAQMP